MASKRRQGFARLAEVGPDALGLSARRARELLLARAWIEVAGQPLASRVAAVSVRRGVLELAAEDQRWAEALADLLPRLAGRVAARHPELGVRKLRVRHGQAREPAVPVTPDPEPDADRGRPPRERGEVRSEPPAPPSREDLEARLRDLAARYLARAAARGTDPGRSSR